MTMAEGRIPLHISKTRLLIQYAASDMPEINYMCLIFFSLSFMMNETTAAGTRPNPIDTTKAIKTPFAALALFLSFYVTG
jgi:hypothetical protein